MSLLRKLFGKKYNVCRECRVHFEPPVGFEAEWDDLCHTHRKPLIEEFHKKQSVMRWAEANWQRLAELKKREEAETNQASQIAMQENLNAMFKNTGNSGSAFMGLGNAAGQRY